MLQRNATGNGLVELCSHWKQAKGENENDVCWIALRHVHIKRMRQWTGSAALSMSLTFSDLSEWLHWKTSHMFTRDKTSLSISLDVNRPLLQFWHSEGDITRLTTKMHIRIRSHSVWTNINKFHCLTFILWHLDEVTLTNTCTWGTIVTHKKGKKN